jgi:hypothetical protein
MKTRNLGILVCLLVAASAFAAGNPNLQPLSGDWNCTGIAFANEMGPEHPTKATVHSAWILNDKWLRVDYKEMKTVKNPHPIAAEMVMTYNEAEKKVASGCLDNMGGYCTEEAPGWDGDSLVLSGNGNFGGKAMKVRDTFTKGKGWIKHMGEVEANGSWMKLDEETCKK